MRLRQTWLAVSLSKSTVMFATVPSSIVVPPLGNSGQTDVRIALASGHSLKAREFWLAISQEDGVT
jgi:hypothetical protein